MRALRLLFFFYLFVELIGVLYVANRWGVFSMFAEVIVSAFIGMLVLINTQASISDTLGGLLSLIHISEPTRRYHTSRMPSSA